MVVPQNKKKEKKMLLTYYNFRTLEDSNPNFWILSYPLSALTQYLLTGVSQVILITMFNFNRYSYFHIYDS